MRAAACDGQVAVQMGSAAVSRGHRQRLPSCSGGGCAAGATSFCMLPYMLRQQRSGPCLRQAALRRVGRSTHPRVHHAQVVAQLVDQARHVSEVGVALVHPHTQHGARVGRRLGAVHVCPVALRSRVAAGARHKVDAVAVRVHVNVQALRVGRVGRRMNRVRVGVRVRLFSGCLWWGLPCGRGLPCYVLLRGPVAGGERRAPCGMLARLEVACTILPVVCADTVTDASALVDAVHGVAHPCTGTCPI